MNYLPFIVSLVILIILLLSGFFFMTRRRKKILANIENDRNWHLREKNATYGNATIVQVDAAMVGEYARQARVSLILNISGEKEANNIKTNWLVDITALDYIKVGSEIAVKIDYENPKIIYPGAPWAKYIRI